MKILMFIFLTGILGNTLANQTSDAFLVRVYDNHVSVISPATKKEQLSVVIENKTLTNIHGKFTTKEGKTLENLTISANSFEVRDLKISQSEIIYFVPLSPPGQEVELTIGKKSYEIPHKK